MLTYMLQDSELRICWTTCDKSVTLNISKKFKSAFLCLAKNNRGILKREIKKMILSTICQKNYPEVIHTDTLLWCDTDSTSVPEVPTFTITAICTGVRTLNLSVRWVTVLLTGATALPHLMLSTGSWHWKEWFYSIITNRIFTLHIRDLIRGNTFDCFLFLTLCFLTTAP